MAWKRFKLPGTGWVKLDQILQKIEDAVNERAPVPGLGIAIEQTSDGSQISWNITPTQGEKDQPIGTQGGGNSGPVVNIFGAVNGLPKVFHLFQSSPPTDP